jgi:ATP-dependent protease ClpP protease subunit
MIRLPALSIRAGERVKQPPRPKGRRWYRIENAAADEATVYVYDYIGWFAVEAEAFVRELAAVTAPTIHVRINSPGGNVFDGSAIYNALRAHPSRIVVHIDGVAASIASIIALAGDEIRIAEGGWYMIHNPFMVAIGDAAEMRKMAELLDKIRAQLAGIYARRTGRELEEIYELMDAESWFGAEEAVEAGFADQVEDGTPAEASHDLSVYDRVPEQLAARAGGGPKQEIRTIRDFEGFLRDAGGFSRAESQRIAAAGYNGTADPRDEGGEPDTVAALAQLIATLTH